MGGSEGEIRKDKKLRELTCELVYFIYIYRCLPKNGKLISMEDVFLLLLQLKVKYVFLKME